MRDRPGLVMETKDVVREVQFNPVSTNDIVAGYESGNIQVRPDMCGFWIYRARSTTHNSDFTVNVALGSSKSEHQRKEVYGTYGICHFS